MTSTRFILSVPHPDVADEVSPRDIAADLRTIADVLDDRGFDGDIVGSWPTMNGTSTWELS